MTEPLVSLSGVTYTYHGASRPAIEGFSLDVEIAEVIALRGPLAVGKSTAIGVLSGELPMLWGGTLVGGASWRRDLLPGVSTSLPDITKIGALLRSPREHFSGFLDSVRDELTFDLEARQWERVKIGDRVRSVAGALGVAHLLDRNPFALSGGERQRVALALAVISDPALIALDDPEAHLDAFARETWLHAVRSVLHHEASIAFEGRSTALSSLNGVRAVEVPSTVNPTRLSPGLDIALDAFTTSVSQLDFHCRRAGYNEDRPILADIEVAISAGQCVGLVGPNGTGKTTLLKALAGVLPYFDGDVLVDGRSIERMPLHHRCRRIALALQEPRDQFFAATVQEEIAFGARVARKFNKPTALATAGIFARLLRVGHLLDRHPRELSRGESRRVGLASTLVLDAPVLLLDEPTVGLDVESLELLASLIANHKKRGGCVIVASHYGEWLATVTDTLVTLRS